MKTKLLYTSAALLIASLMLALPTSTPQSAKTRTKSSAPPAGAKTAKPASSGYSSVRLNRATNSVVLNLFNLANVKKVNYALSYIANGKEEGIGGSINVSGQSTDKRDLYFGTCSSGVCTPHRNIKNATLTVTATLTNGKTATKRYLIRI